MAKRKDSKEKEAKLQQGTFDEALVDLEKLMKVVRGTGSLTLLRGFDVRHLNLNESRQFASLEQLRGMHLRSLALYNTQVSDLEPLRGMRLEWLNISGTRVTDLSPLRGMQLREFYAINTKVEDITPLCGMPIEYLYLSRSQVSDLSVLRGMPLKWLDLAGTPALSCLPDWLPDTCRVSTT